MVDAAARSVLIGRVEVLEVLLSATQDPRAGASRLLLVTGEPGMGKTRLLHEATSRSPELGVRAVRATCWDGDGTPAFWPWTQILRGCAEGRTRPELRTRWGPRAGEALALVPEL